MDPSGYASCQTTDPTSCLEEGENTVTDEDGNESIVVVAEKGARIEVQTSNGSYHGIFTGLSGRISGVFGGGAPASLGEISDRTNGAVNAVAVATPLGADLMMSLETRAHYIAESMAHEARKMMATAEMWQRIVASEAIQPVYPEEFLPVGRAASAAKSGSSWLLGQVSARFGRRATAERGGAQILRSAGAAVNRSVSFASQSQLAKKFHVHAVDFGVTGPWNKPNAEAFVRAMQAHIDDPATVLIQGTYRWKQEVTHFYNSNTGLFLMRDANFNFVSGWRLDPRQVADLLEKGNVY